MLRHGQFGTETDKAPLVFTCAAFFCCLTAALLCFFLGGSALAVFAGVLLSIVAAAALVVLLAMLTDYAYVRDGALHIRYLLKKREVALTDIGKLTHKDEVYSVFDKKGALIGTINARLTGIDRVLSALDRGGVPFE